MLTAMSLLYIGNAVVQQGQMFWAADAIALTLKAMTNFYRSIIILCLTKFYTYTL
jgi:hypothetical protein